MFRAFTVTLPADTNNHNLYAALLAITGAIPTDGILVDRVNYLEIQADLANASTLTVNDENYANTTGKVLNAGNVYNRQSTRNTICLRDYYLQGGAASQKVEVTLESM